MHFALSCWPRIFAGLSLSQTLSKELEGYVDTDAAGIGVDPSESRASDSVEHYSSL